MPMSSLELCEAAGKKHEDANACFKPKKSLAGQLNYICVRAK